MLWAAISGAQSTPSRVQTSVRFNYAAYPGPGGLPILISLFGNPKLENERLTATEAGFRKQWSTVLSFEATAFSISIVILLRRNRDPRFWRRILHQSTCCVPIYLGNLLHGETHGMEVFANVRLANRWTLSPGYTFLAMHLHPNVGSTDLTTAPETEGGSPQATSGAAFASESSPALGVDHIGLFRRPPHRTRDPVLYPPGYEFGVATLGKNITGPGGTELAEKPSPGVLRAGLDRAAEPGSAQRLCQAHVAVLNVHEVILPSRLCGPRPGGRVRGSLEHSSVTRSMALLAVLLSILLVGGGHGGRAQTTEEEYRVKAAFIFHFAQLVDWPTDTATDTDNSLFLCTLGEDPFQGMLESTVAGKVIGNRVMRIRHLGQAQDAQSLPNPFYRQGRKANAFLNWWRVCAMLRF